MILNSQFLKLLFLIVLIGICSCRQAPTLPYSIQKVDEGEHAMVVTAHPLATQVGLEILKQGGNAIDAGIAVQFALAVVYPRAGNIGGGGFAVYREANGAVNSLDFREKAPSKGYRDMYLDENGEVIPRKSLDGALAVGVPGAVDGMVQLYERYSRLKDWKALVQPAIDIANQGFNLTQKGTDALNEYRANFEQFSSRDTPFKRASDFKEGDLLVQKDLARTLERIRDLGREGFYGGETADLLVAEMQAGSGLISKADLKAYQSTWRTPIQFQYRGYDITSMPPPSSGGIALAQILGMLEAYPLGQIPMHSAESIHLIAEAERRAFADRSKHLGDPDFYPVPVDTLMSKAYLTSRMETFRADTISPSAAITPGIFSTPVESEETTHFSIVDSLGNALSITTTLNANFGSKIVVGGAGFFLNNEMDDFSSKPGVPNLFGLIGGEANAIEPGKRMLSSMTPTILSKDGQLEFVVGTPGGSTIITSVLQLIINHVDYGLNAEQANNAPRFHHQWLPDRITLEENQFRPSVLDSLRMLGHELKFRPYIGLVEAIEIQEDGTLLGSGDRRGTDDARGF